MTAIQETVVLMVRQTIARAIDLVMDRFQLDQERAFLYLVRVAQSSNLSLRLVAEELVDTLQQAGDVRPAGVGQAGPR